ncbi:unnamed protein product [Ectocarpus sp. 6 AP-2014]
MAPAVRSANPGNGHPGAASCLCSIVNISFGGWWGDTLFRPLYQQGPERDAVHVVFTTYSTADYVPNLLNCGLRADLCGCSRFGATSGHGWVATPQPLRGDVP